MYLRQLAASGPAGCRRIAKGTSPSERWLTGGGTRGETERRSKLDAVCARGPSGGLSVGAEQRCRRKRVDDGMREG